MKDKSAATREGHEEAKLSALERTGRRLVYFAAERTLLTWVRIALTLMGFGFVIDRFSLVFRNNAIPWLGTPIPSWAGSGMIILGSLVSLVAAASYFRFTLRYRQGDETPGQGLMFGVMLSIIVALLGIVIFFFLLHIPF